MAAGHCRLKTNATSLASAVSILLVTPSRETSQTSGWSDVQRSLSRIRCSRGRLAAGRGTDARASAPGEKRAKRLPNTAEQSTHCDVQVVDAVTRMGGGTH